MMLNVLKSQQNEVQQFKKIDLLSGVQNIQEEIGEVQIVQDTLEGKFIADRYRVEKYLQNGQNCQLYTVTDIKQQYSAQPLILKIREFSSTTLNEIKTLDLLQGR